MKEIDQHISNSFIFPCVFQWNWSKSINSLNQRIFKEFIFLLFCYRMENSLKILWKFFENYLIQRIFKELNFLIVLLQNAKSKNFQRIFNENFFWKFFDSKNFQRNGTWPWLARLGPGPRMAMHVAATTMLNPESSPVLITPGRAQVAHFHVVGSPGPAPVPHSCWRDRVWSSSLTSKPPWRKPSRCQESTPPHDWSKYASGNKENATFKYWNSGFIFFWILAAWPSCPGIGRPGHQQNERFHPWRHDTPTHWWMLMLGPAVCPCVVRLAGPSPHCYIGETTGWGDHRFP